MRRAMRQSVFFGYDALEASNVTPLEQFAVLGYANADDAQPKTFFHVNAADGAAAVEMARQHAAAAGLARFENRCVMRASRAFHAGVVSHGPAPKLRSTAH